MKDYDLRDNRLIGITYSFEWELEWECDLEGVVGGEEERDEGLTAAVALSLHKSSSLVRN